MRISDPVTLSTLPDEVLAIIAKFLVPRETFGKKPTREPLVNFSKVSRRMREVTRDARKQMLDYDVRVYVSKKYFQGDSVFRNYILTEKFPMALQAMADSKKPSAYHPQMSLPLKSQEYFIDRRIQTLIATPALLHG
jgi:hypothetical protein